MVLNGSVIFNNIMPNNWFIKKAAIGRPDKSVSTPKNVIK